MCERGGSFLVPTAHAARRRPMDRPNLGAENPQFRFRSDSDFLSLGRSENPSFPIFRHDQGVAKRTRNGSEARLLRRLGARGPQRYRLDASADISAMSRAGPIRNRCGRHIMRKVDPAAIDVGDNVLLASSEPIQKRTRQQLMHGHAFLSVPTSVSQRYRTSRRLRQTAHQRPSAKSALPSEAVEARSSRWAGCCPLTNIRSWAGCPSTLDDALRQSKRPREAK